MKVPKMKNPPPPPENSMAQANANYDRWKDARNVGQALIDYCHGQEPSNLFTPIMILDLRAFAKFFAQRCGVVFTDNEPSNNP